MELRLLGPFEASVDGHPVRLGAAKQRAVLAMLALRPNATVSADELMEGLWGEHPPSSAPKMVQQYISQLRRLLAPDGGGIVTRGRGYELRVPLDAVDASRFVRLVDRGSAREGLALWRGDALADIADEPFAAAEIRRLDELRLRALEQAVDADLAEGRHRELVGELDWLVAEHGLSERLQAQLMLALYRCGRQAEALDAYRRARTLLVEEVGIEPGPELQRLHAAILRQDPSLDPPAGEALPPELVASSPMFGRASELVRLREAWERAREGAGAVVVVSGAPGSGRTRLAAELAGELHRQGVAVRYGAAAAAGLESIRRPALLVLDDEPGVLARVAQVASAPVLCVVRSSDANLVERLPGAEDLRLGPLGPEAITAIARLYGAEIAAAELTERSGGVPGRVHALAAERARAHAERLVSAEAERTAGERKALRRAELRLADTVGELQSARERAERHDAVRATVLCPYKGLASFDRPDAAFFFGRERLVAEMVARLVGAPLLGVMGPSGSGKSSAVRAGLLAELASGVLPGSEGWSQAVLRPGEHPLATLSRATAEAGRGNRLLIAVDQFEETFTVCRDDAERAAFIGALVAAAGEGAAVVLAVRADFYGRCSEDPALASLLAANQVLVGPMRRDELRRAIELPAQRAGLSVEAELVDALLVDTSDEPGALPLLSSALLELWQQRDGNRLRLVAYERTGGLRGAVGRLAETAYERLDGEQQTVARRILLRLAGDEGVGTPVRRRVPLAELEPDRDDRSRHVLEVLADSRLVTVSEGSAEVAHEALLHEWPRLRAWLQQDAEGRRLHRRLIDAAAGWSDGGRDRGELYQGARLAAALEWRAEHAPELNSTEQQFLDASRIASERARRRIRLALAGVVALLIVIAAAGLVALDQRGRARTQARAAEAQRLGAQALNQDSLDLSLLLARQGVALDDTPATRDDLLAALRRSPAAIGVTRASASGLAAADLAPGDRILAVGDINGATIFLDPGSRRRLAAYRSDAGRTITELASSPDGTRLAAAGTDLDGAGFAELFDLRTRRHITDLETLPGKLLFHVDSLVFSPDSRQLTLEGGDEVGQVTRLLRFDARTGRRLGGSRPIPGHGARLLGFVGPGARPVTSSVADDATVIRDPVTLRAQRRFAIASSIAALNPALGLIAFAPHDGTVRLLDIDTGRLRIARGRHDAAVTAMAFSADRHRLVTAGGDQRLIVWDTDRAAAVETLQARGVGPIQAVAVTADGRTAYSAGRDGTAVTWDLAGTRRLERPLLADGAPAAARFLAPSGRGSRFAVAGPTGSVALFDGRTERLTARVRTGRRPPSGVALSSDGRTLAATRADGRLGFWDAATGRPLGAPQQAYAHPARVALTFSGDGRWLATAPKEGKGTIVRLWDARRHAPVDSLVLDNVRDLSLNPDGTLLAATLVEAGGGGGLEIISVPALKVIRTVPAPAGTLGRFTPDGRSLIYGDRDGRLWTYDTPTWKRRDRPLSASAAVLTADLSPDSSLLATTSADGTGRLWDVASGRAIGDDLAGAPGTLVGAGFVDQGRKLVVVHDRGGYVWDVRAATWERHACAVAGRVLTRAEWNDALPGRTYAPMCARR